MQREILNENVLLSDEDEISLDDFKERKEIMSSMVDLPVDFFSKLRHFQPQIGCLNACSICSKIARSKTEQWNINRQRNVIAAIKAIVLQKYRNERPLIVWDRSEHRSGVIFSYLDNDIGNYLYLDEFIKLAYQELGVRTRISTVGYSRHNTKLNDMHKRINQSENIEALGGVRLSFTPYAIGWKREQSNLFSREEYIKDMSNFLSIYKPYHEKVGSGSRKMCVELRYKPLVGIHRVFDLEILNHKILYVNKHLYISERINVELKEAKILDPYNHNISLTEQPEMFYELHVQLDEKSYENMEKEIKYYIRNEITDLKNRVELYKMCNYDGIYYAINPKLTEFGNYGINIYPKTEKRKNSGYIITERFFLNALLKYKVKKGIRRQEIFESANWKDVDNVIDECKFQMEEFRKTKDVEKADYIEAEILPMIMAYKDSLKCAGYEAKDFFDPKFTIDTGIICNMGRAISEFKGLVTVENEPLTPNHERNYGKYNSTMTCEGSAWRLSCDYENKIVIEKLELRDTATRIGQVSYRKTVQLNAEKNEKYLSKDFENNYLIPGQKRR